MNRVVLEPVELLVDGAKRIQDGNMEEEIDYQGEAEFERVCQSFNDMQAAPFWKIRNSGRKMRKPEPIW